MKSFEPKAAIEYPRKRASIACNFCRHRKRKCDGQKPTCGLCTDAGAQCIYQESERVQDVPAEILFRLSHLELLLEQQKDAISKLTAQIAAQSPSDQSLLSNTAVYVSQMGPSWDPPNENQYDRPSLDDSFQQSPNSYNVPFTMLLDHQTPTGSLFALDHIKFLIGDYPHNFFYLLELNRPFDNFEDPGIPHSFDQINGCRLDAVQDALIGEFLKNVHPFFPIIDEKLIPLLFQTFPSSSTATGVDTSLCLLILALGKISSNPRVDFDIESDKDASGVEYFAPAYHNLNNGPKSPFSTNHLLPLALLYASLYLRYIGRPVQAWSMIELASASVRFMILQLHGESMDDVRASLYRTAWGCYILECDDLAEFQFPPSGIKTVVDSLNFDKPLFPGFSNLADARKSREAFLAMCLIRIILNRVQENSHSISPTLHTHDVTAKSPPKTSMGSLERICLELDRQLESWFESLPPTIKPNLSAPISQADPYDIYMRARYYATKHIICRPSLVFAAQLTTPIPMYIYENCKKCIKGCRDFIWATAILLRKRTHATYLRMQALLAAVFTLSIAKTSPSLATLIQDPEFDYCIGEAIESIEPWAQHSETADVILGMMKTIRRKVRVSMQASLNQ